METYKILSKTIIKRVKDNKTYLYKLYDEKTGAIVFHIVSLFICRIADIDDKVLCTKFNWHLVKKELTLSEFTVEVMGREVEMTLTKLPYLKKVTAISKSIDDRNRERKRFYDRTYNNTHEKD